MNVPDTLVIELMQAIDEMLDNSSHYSTCDKQAGPSYRCDCGFDTASLRLNQAFSAIKNLWTP